ncbi:MAG: DUF362 domain-containing protein [Deltaproteobacteria bacterium]|jgi:uncharacterized protein (DUF362 family)|nr:DUF362 domain-containing protein [Deltaproteobacteria bacterium]
MNRRQFLKSMAVAVAGTAITSKLKVTAAESLVQDGISAELPDLVAVRNGEPIAMFRKGIEALGGMQSFVKPEQKVIIKPNISFDSAPERAANTNPELVGEVVRQALAAGAKEVLVFDHTLSDWKTTYKVSGTQEAVEQAGGKMILADEKKFYINQKNVKALKLQETDVFKPLLEADVFINLPILKHHGGAKMSCAIKNLMGNVWDRRIMHRSDLNQCIAEMLFYTKPTLNIIDAYRIMIANGPRGVSTDDVRLTKYMIISTDIVAADVAATKIIGYELDEVPYIKIAENLGFGKSDITKLNIARLEA